MVPMRTDLLELFDVNELHKYMTDDELAGLPGADGQTASAAEEKSSEASEAPARKAEE